MVAWLQVGHTVIHGVNSTSNSKNFFRRYHNGTAFDAHAETACIKRAQAKLNNIEGSDLWVMRFRADGSVGCSKPCSHCQEAIRAAGIRRVYYTNAQGNWEIMKF